MGKNAQRVWKGNLEEKIQMTNTLEKMLKSLIVKYIQQCNITFHALFFICQKKKEKEKKSFYDGRDMEGKIAFIKCRLWIWIIRTLWKSYLIKLLNFKIYISFKVTAPLLRSCPIMIKTPIWKNICTYMLQYCL